MAKIKKYGYYYDVEYVRPTGHHLRESFDSLENAKKFKSAIEKDIAIEKRKMKI